MLDGAHLRVVKTAQSWSSALQMMVPAGRVGIEVQQDSPWAWRPSPKAALQRLTRAMIDSAGLKSVGIATAEVAEGLQSIDLSDARWLLTPLLAGASVGDCPEAAEARAFQFAILLAAHGLLRAPKIYTARSIWMWTPQGGVQLEPGWHEMTPLAAALTADQALTPVGLDVWCHTLGLPMRSSWAALPAARCMARASELEANLLGFLQAVSRLNHYLPACAAWVSAGVSVIVPLCADDGELFRSRSDPEIPGLVQMDTAAGGLCVLEALVHETAHHHLYLAEADAPLVRPDDERVYKSPLRDDPRPLRGILMAWHALAYIRLLYRELAQIGLLKDARPDIDRVQTMLDDAESAIDAGQDGLSSSGADFVAKTWEVARHGAA